MFIFYNPNPMAARVGDCVIRAVGLAMNKDWDHAYIDLCIYGLMNGNMPSANSVWGKYLSDQGFVRKIIQPIDYTVSDFAADNPEGTYVLGLNGHVVTVVDGNWMDTWDSGSETPIYYWERRP